MRVDGIISAFKVVGIDQFVDHLAMLVQQEIKSFPITFSDPFQNMIDILHTQIIDQKKRLCLSKVSQ